jgi:hypothetical protein
MYYAYMNYIYIMQENVHLIDNRQLGYLVPGGNKYRNITLQVGGVSEVESMHCAQLKTTDSTSRQRGRPTSLNQKATKNHSRKEEKLVAGPKGVPDTKTD